MSTHPTAYDLVVIGGGPAGCAAAVGARRGGLNTLLVAGANHPGRAETCGAWISPAAAKICRECGVDVAPLGTPFNGLRLWTWDLARRAEVDDPELTGWVVEPQVLREALVAATAAAGARVLAPARVTQIRPGESSVTVTLARGAVVAGQAVVVADGAGSTCAGMAQLSGAAPRAAGGTAATALLDAVPSASPSRDRKGADEPSASPSRDRKGADEPSAGEKLDVVLRASRAITVATFARAADRRRVFLATGDRSAPAAAHLTALLTAGQAAGIVPRGAAVAVSPVPDLAGLALEAESHVGKRCLVIGDAGGFVTAFSHEGLYPAMRSGWLAAETVVRALKAGVMQDELVSFDAAWRADLADYLRMPNTDLGLLLPMVFGNPQMSRRLARAFLLGQAF